MINHRRHHMQVSFGRPGKCKKSCPCPPKCKSLCARIKLTAERSPRVVGRRRKAWRFTPLHNHVLYHWGEADPGIPVRMTYAVLVSCLAGENRWVFVDPKTIAQRIGIGVKQYREHLKVLEDLGLILVMPRRDLDSAYRWPGNTVIVLDLPDWLAPPIHPDLDEDEE